MLAICIILLCEIATMLHLGPLLFHLYGHDVLNVVNSQLAQINGIGLLGADYL